jgi:HAD superfamily hydrolase (TIGR01458 family)
MPDAKPDAKPEPPGVRAVLVDIDGVLTVSWQALPGAREAFARLRGSGLSFCLLTNTTSRTRASIAENLRRAGFDVADEDIVTVPALTAGWLREHHPNAGCLLLNHGDISEDLTGVDLAGPGGEVDVVLLGGAGPEFSYEALNRAYAAVREGAALVAMNPNLTWRTEAGLQLDTGAFLAGLERAAGVRAEVIGKPAPAFFRAALARLGADAEHTLMVGDDVVSDVLGAQRAGLTGVLVRTGKFSEQTLTRANGTPSHVINSFADLPDLLDKLTR